MEVFGSLPPVFPETKILKFSRGYAFCEGKGIVDNKLACSAEFNLILPDELKKYSIK